MNTAHERRTIVTRLRSLMDFSLRCVRFYPGVNSRAELVTLAPGLRPERRFAPLARGLSIDEHVTPVAQKHRRVPFHLREKLDAELERLEKAESH